MSPSGASPGCGPIAPVALITDFGQNDHYTGCLHAVLEREAPGLARIDIMHTVPPGDIWRACFHLRCAWDHLPDPAVVLAVVDPGVGTGRAALAGRLGRRWLVAPDNGLAAAMGTPDEARRIDWQVMALAEPSATFHGRDLFAPAAARLAAGVSGEAVGPAHDPSSLVCCPLPEPVEEGRCIVATVLHVDCFGNVITNVRASTLGPGAVARCGGRIISRRVVTYGEAPGAEPILLAGSSGHLELALNRGSAAQVLGVLQGSRLEIWPDGLQESEPSRPFQP